MNKFIIKTCATIFSLSILILPFFAFAQIENPLKNSSSVPELISTLLSYIVKIGGVFATFMFILAGFLYVKAQGNDKELAKAKEIFLNTCIGTAVLLGAQLISTIITNTISSLKS